MLLIAGTALAIAAVPVAAVSAMGNGYHGSFGSGDQVQLQTQDKTQQATQDAMHDMDRDQKRLHQQDGTGENHENCDGTPGDEHRYHGSD
jgi:hypothetical protein